jgi:MFS family permease
VGIALGMLSYPVLAETAGLTVALGAVAFYPLLTLLALLLLYRSPATHQPVSTKDSAFPAGGALAATIMAGAVWGLYNVALGTIIGFVTLVLHEDGWPNLEANQAASLIMWVVALSVPLGGVLADRTRRSGAVILGGLGAFAVALLAMTRMEPIIAIILVAGFVGGLPAGAIMGLAPSVLDRGTRSLGMGLFFTVFYLLQLVGPWLVGIAAESAGRTSLALDCGAVAAVLACLCFAVFASLRKRIVLPA